MDERICTYLNELEKQLSSLPKPKEEKPLTIIGNI